MTAKGKVTASKVEIGQRVLVERESADLAKLMNREPILVPSSRSTKATVARVLDIKIEMEEADGYYRTRAVRYYRIITTAGPVVVVAHSTLTLTPETPAAVNRAHAQALEEDQVRSLNKAEEERRSATPSTQGLTPPALTEDEAVAAIQEATKDPRAVTIIEVRGPVAEVAELTPPLAEEEAPRDTTYTVQFARIGAHFTVPSLTVTVPADRMGSAGDFVAEAVWRYAGKFLVSGEFMVDVNLFTGIVWIDRGRFGKGNVKEATLQMA